MSFDLSDKIDHKILVKSENLLSKLKIEENTYDIRELKHLRNENPYRVIIGHIIINSIRNKFESLAKYVGNNLDIHMVSETKSENLLSKLKIEENTYDIRELKHLRNENPYRVIIGHIIINSIRNKFESLAKYVGNNLDIHMVSETKIEYAFPESQFLIEVSAKGGGILLYIREDVPSRYLKKITANELFEG